MQLVATVAAQGELPSLFITQPSGNAVVQGTVTLQAAAGGPGLASVHFLVDGQPVGSDITSGSCSASWNSATVPDGTHALAVAGLDETGASTTSDEVSVTVANEALRVSKIVAWDVTTTAASITWTSNRPADGVVEFGVTPAYLNRTPRRDDSATLHTLVLTGLMPGTRYHYRVRSQDALGHTSTSSDLTFVTAGTPVSTAAALGTALNQKISSLFGIPNILSQRLLNATSDSLTLTWTTDQPTDGQIEYGLTGRLGTLSIRDTQLATTHVITLTGLTPGKTYFFRIRSKNAQGKQTTSPLAKVSTSPR